VTPATVDQLRHLIASAAPDPAHAAAVRRCAPDAPLDAVMPFSSVMVLGVIVAVEDRYGVVVTREAAETAFAGGATLEKLAVMVQRLAG
jgi:hypothetical protein